MHQAEFVRLLRTYAELVSEASEAWWLIGNEGGRVSFSQFQSNWRRSPDEPSVGDVFKCIDEAVRNQVTSCR